MSSMQTERLAPLAKQLLTLPVDEGRVDLWLWEHSDRVMHLAQSIAALPEVHGASADRAVLVAAALFHDAGWAVEYQQGRIERWQILTRPTNDIQRELGAAMLQEEAGHLLSGQTVHLATEAIRLCNVRHADMLEARILAEAEALDEISVIYVFRQYRLYQFEGRTIQQLTDSWQRLKEYQYWDARLNDGFRFESTRALARKRLEAIDAFMQALRAGIRGDDVRQLLQITGVTVGEEAG